MGQWLTNTATALEEHPHTVARFLVDTARRPHLCYREPEGQGGFWVHLQQVPRYRPRVRCHRRRCWRCWSACGLRSRRGWLQHRLYLQALPYTFAHCRCAGWYQCCSRKVRLKHVTLVVQQKADIQIQHARRRLEMAHVRYCEGLGLAR